MVRVIDVTAREFALDGDRTHVLDRHLSAKGLSNQHTVLINVFSLKLDKSLADGLDKADPAKVFAQGGIETKRRGGLACILLRGCDEDTRCGRVQRET